MQRIELLVALEEEMGGNLEESRLAEIYTVRALVEAVLEGASRGRTGSRPQFAGWSAILSEDPADPEILALAEPRRAGEAFWFTLSRLIQLFARDRFQLQVEGLEKLPTRGPFVICSNHQSYIDPLVLASVLPWPLFQNTFAVGTSDVFGSGFMRRLARWLRVVVVDPDRNLIPAMRAGAFGLRQGRILVLYPEGERSIDGTPKTFKKGAAILSIHRQVPIVPVAIEGFHAAWPRGKSFARFAPLRMVFGDPIYPPPESEASEATYAQLTATLKTRVVGTWDELRRKTPPGDGSLAG
jgi:1-acyl-sn-glycerol-3-phosphate acyltransferase